MLECNEIHIVSCDGDVKLYVIFGLIEELRYNPMRVLWCAIMYVRFLFISGDSHYDEILSEEDWCQQPARQKLRGS